MANLMDAIKLVEATRVDNISAAKSHKAGCVCKACKDKMQAKAVKYGLPKSGKDIKDKMKENRDSKVINVDESNPKGQASDNVAAGGQGSGRHPEIDAMHSHLTGKGFQYAYGKDKDKESLSKLQKGGHSVWIHNNSGAYAHENNTGTATHATGGTGIAALKTERL